MIRRLLRSPVDVYVALVTSIGAAVVGMSIGQLPTTPHAREWFALAVLAITARDWWSAWNENAILERFYAPVLDRGSRWTADQHDQIDRRAHETPRAPYRSDAAPYPIYLIRRTIFWPVALLLVAAIVGAAYRTGTTEPVPV